MIEIIKQLLQKLFSQDWGRIFSALKWIYCYVRRYWIQIMIYTALGFCGTVFGLLSSVVSKNLIDAVTGFNTDSIGWAAAFYVGLGVSRVFINIITGRISLLIQSKVQNEIQADVFDQIMLTDWESMSQYSTGDLMMRSLGDSSVISDSVLHFIPNAVTTITQFIGAFVIVCRHDPIMALIALGGAPVTFLTSRYRMNKMHGFQKEAQKMSSDKMTFDQETFQNVQAIKAFGLIDQFSQKMRSIQKQMLDFSLRQYKYQSVSGIVMSLTGMAVGYACYGFAVFRLWQGDISYGTMTLFLSLSSSLSGSFSSVIHLVPSAIRAASSAERIMEIIGLPRESYDDLETALEIKAESKNTGVCIKADNLSFRYKNGNEVYSGISFEANPGEIIALAGPSGQGKTTTLRLLLGLLAPESGSLTAGNPGGNSIPVSPSTRCLFSYVPQGNMMFSGTIAENLRMMRPDASEDEMKEALILACAWDFVSALEDGIYTKIGERGGGFSEGQNQRLSIARALLSDAPVLLLDEVTSALDMETEKKLLDNIIKSDIHKTIIIVAHRPSVFSMCDRIYRIAAGGISDADKYSYAESEAEKV